MLISDWSSDVCSSDLVVARLRRVQRNPGRVVPGRCAPAEEAHRQVPQTLPVDQGDGEDGAGLDRDVEQVAAVAQPVLGNQKVPGAGARPELGDALDDAKQPGGEEVDRTGGVEGKRVSG